MHGERPADWPDLDSAVRDLAHCGRIGLHPFAVKRREHEPPLATVPCAVHDEDRIGTQDGPQELRYRLAVGERVALPGKDLSDVGGVAEDDSGRLREEPNGKAIAVALPVPVEKP